jgi:hypothetical protein
VAGDCVQVVPFVTVVKSHCTQNGPGEGLEREKLLPHRRCEPEDEYSHCADRCVPAQRVSAKAADYAQNDPRQRQLTTPAIKPHQARVEKWKTNDRVSVQEPAEGEERRASG